MQALKRSYFLLLSTFLLIYILFNLLNGERGLLSYFEKKEIQNQLIQKKNNLTTELHVVEKKIIFLSDDINLDYLETLYRNKFFYGKSDERVFLIKSNDN